MPKEKWRETDGYDLDSDESQLEIIDEGYRKYRRPDAEEPGEREARQARAQKLLIIAGSVIGVCIVAAILLSYGGSRQDEESQLSDITSLNEATYLFVQEDTTAVGYIRRKFKHVGDMLQLEDGIVASFLFEQHPVEIWIGISLLQESAAEALSLMLEETDPDLHTDTIWRSQSQFEREGKTITQAVGSGQRNYFFRDSNMIVWVQADSIAATYALQATLNTNLQNWIESVRQGGTPYN